MTLNYWTVCSAVWIIWWIVFLTNLERFLNGQENQLFISKYIDVSCNFSYCSPNVQSVIKHWVILVFRQNVLQQKKSQNYFHGNLDTHEQISLLNPNKCGKAVVSIPDRISLEQDYIKNIAIQCRACIYVNIKKPATVQREFRKTFKVSLSKKPYSENFTHFHCICFFCLFRFLLEATHRLKYVCCTWLCLWHVLIIFNL